MLDLFLATIQGLSMFFIVEVFLLLALLFISEGVEHGGVALVSIIAFYGVCFIRHETGYIPTISVLDVVIYVLIGLLYALIRLYLAGVNKKVYLFTVRDEQSAEKTAKDNAKEIMSFIKNHFFRWWTIWPISLLSGFLLTFLHSLKNFSLNLLKIY